MVAYIAKGFFLIIAVFFLATSASPDCLSVANGQLVKITVKECRKILPSDPLLVQADPGPAMSENERRDLYTGAFLTDAKGMKWMYPSKQSEPCHDFKVNTSVTKLAYETCCDTGSWGKCLLGGNFLGHVGGKKINAFQ